MTIALIVVCGQKGEIGVSNKLLTNNLKSDMQLFRAITTQYKRCIMGRKTYESIGKALPNRMNYVLTNDSSFHDDNIFIVREGVEWLKEIMIKSKDNYIICGGSQIYREFLHLVDRMYISHIDHTFPEADAFFPLEVLNDFKLTSQDHYKQDGNNDYSFDFCVYDRIRE